MPATGRAAGIEVSRQSYSRLYDKPVRVARRAFERMQQAPGGIDRGEAVEKRARAFLQAARGHIRRLAEGPSPKFAGFRPKRNVTVC